MPELAQLEEALPVSVAPEEVVVVLVVRVPVLHSCVLEWAYPNGSHRASHRAQMTVDQRQPGSALHPMT